MKNLIFILVTLFAFQVDAQTYRSLDDITKDAVKRSEWKQAVKETKEAQNSFDIYLPPLDRVVSEVKPSIAARTINGVGVNSWGRDVLLPSSIRDRVVNECGAYNFALVTVDSGVDPTHNEYSGAWWLPPSNYSGDQSKHWHGTHVTGIMWQLVGELAQAKGNVRFKDAQILGGTGGGSFTGAVNMANSETSYFEDMAANGWGVIFNNSWGGSIPPYAPFEAAVSASLDKGMIWTAANGNTGGETLSYPASGKDIISVASLDNNLRRSSFSTTGDFTDAAMPGRNINSTMPNQSEGVASGTSMADPFLSALCGLAYGKYGTILQGRNMGLYIHSVCSDIDPSGFDDRTGYGIPYVIKMLDTNPCKVIDCDNEPDDPDVPSDPVLNYVSGDFEGYTMRWNYEGASGWFVLHIPHLRIEALGDGKSEQVHDELSRFLPAYFNNRGIHLPSDMSTQDAVWWTGQFLEYIAKQKGLTLDVLELNAIDENGRVYYSTSFDKAAVEFLSMINNVKLIEIK